MVHIYVFKRNFLPYDSLMAQAKLQEYFVPKKKAE